MQHTEDFEVIQQWEGVVTDTTCDSFYAELQDVHDKSLPIEIVEIPFDKVPIDDQSLIAEGTVFYWSIGYKTHAWGQITMQSKFNFLC